MLRTLMWAAVVALTIVGMAQGANFWTNPADPSYPSLTRDAKLRSDGGLQDWNLGAASGGSNRLYAANYDNGGVITPTNRSTNFLQWFDVSSIPAGSTIDSATFWVYMGYGNTGSVFQDVKLSRLKAGKSWVEGTGQGPATDGSVTWNNRVSSASPVPWDAPGATGDDDIDLATTKTFGWDHANDWLAIDIKDWVQDWVNGSWENNGMVLWGGTVMNLDPAKYYLYNTKEDGNKPELDVNYTVPEPGTLLLLAGGLAFIRRRSAR